MQAAKVISISETIPQRPVVFDYLDYRNYLKDYYTFKRTSFPAFSFRIFSKKAGMASPNYMTMIINQARCLSPRYIPNVAKYCQMDDQETLYFRALINWCDAKSPKKREQNWKRLLEAKPTMDYYEPKDDALRVYLNWQAVAILEMIRLKDFKNDIDWIQKRFNGEVDAEHIRKYINDLIHTGFITEDQTGTLQPANEINFTGGEVPSRMIQMYHQSVGHEAIRAIYNVPVEQREFAATTFGVSQSDLPILKEEIKEFQRRVLKRLKQTEPSEVYQLNIQFFPLTKKNNLKTDS